jgi:hypothetical protein
MEHFPHRLQGKRKEQNDGRSTGNVLPHGVVQQISIEGDTVTDGAAIAFRESIANFRAASVIFDGLRVGL